MKLRDSFSLVEPSWSTVQLLAGWPNFLGHIVWKCLKHLDCSPARNTDAGQCSHRASLTEAQAEATTTPTASKQSNYTNFSEVYPDMSPSSYGGLWLLSFWPRISDLKISTWTIDENWPRWEGSPSPKYASLPQRRQAVAEDAQEAHRTFDLQIYSWDGMIKHDFQPKICLEYYDKIRYDIFTHTVFFHIITAYACNFASPFGQKSGPSAPGHRLGASRRGVAQLDAGVDQNSAQSGEGRW